MLTATEIGKILIVLATAYPRFKLDEQTLKVYHQLLKDIPAEELNAAAMKCIAEKDFFPSVHELRAAVSDLRRQSVKIPNAYEAWEDLRKAGNGSRREVLEDDGSFYIDYGEYQFKHPLVKRVAQMLGWPRDFPGDDNLMADRAHFFKAYEQAVREALEEDIQLPEVKAYIERARLEGGNEQNNRIAQVGEVAKSLESGLHRS